MAMPKGPNDGSYETLTRRFHEACEEFDAKTQAQEQEIRILKLNIKRLDGDRKLVVHKLRRAINEIQQLKDAVPSGEKLPVKATVTHMNVEQDTQSIQSMDGSVRQVQGETRTLMDVELDVSALTSDQMDELRKRLENGQL